MVGLLVKPQVGLIFWQTIIVIIGYVTLRKLAWGPILSFMETQEEAYAAAVAKIEKSEKVVILAEKKRERILGEAEAKRERMMNKAMAVKSALIEEATIESDQLRKDMLKKAKQEIAKERQVALDSFKGEAGTLVVAAAQKLIGRELAKEHVQHMVLQHMIDEVIAEKQQL